MKHKVLELVQSLDKGGRTEHIVQLSRKLTEMGNSVYTCVMQKPPTWIYEKYPEANYWKVEEKPVKFKLSYFIKLYRLVNKLQVEIIHAHCEASHLYAGLISLLTKIPVIGTYHRPKESAYQDSWRNRVVKYLLMSHVAVANNRKQLMVDSLKISENKISVIYNGVDIASFKKNLEDKKLLRNLLNIPEVNRVLLSLGHLGEIKGHSYTIKAFNDILKRHPDTLLYIAGSGSDEEKEELLKLTHELSLQDKIIFLGQVNNPSQWLNVCEVLLHMPLEEAFPLVILESGASKKPVIATSVGGIPEVIKHGENGYLINVKDYRALAELTIELLSFPDKAKEMGNVAYRIIEGRFTLEHMARQYVNLMDKLSHN